jgi:hypothetical protein
MGFTIRVLSNVVLVCFEPALTDAVLDTNVGYDRMANIGGA